MAAVTVSRTGDRLIAIKAVAAERASEVEREANLLQQLNHPGVVRFVDLVETPDGGRALHTLFVSSDTWATRPLSEPVERAAGMAALAAVVADLHDLGLTHRYITAGHVLHGDDDRPVLCSLTRAGDAAVENRRIDLDALAELVHESGMGRRPMAGKLASLADEMRAGRLSARGLARRLDRLLAREALHDGKGDRSGWLEALRRTRQRTAELTGRLSGRLRLRAWKRRPVQLGTAVTAGLGLTGLVAIAAMLVSSLSGRSRQPAGADRRISSTLEMPNGIGDTVLSGGDHVAGAETAGLRSATAYALPLNSAPTVGVDAPSPGDGRSFKHDSSSVGDSSPRAISDAAGKAGRAAADGGVADDLATGRAAADDDPAADGGVVLEHNGRRYAIGIRGDIVAPGDWDCDGVATPSIVRPGNGAVVLFDIWPGPGETISRPIRWHVDKPIEAWIEPRGDCDILRVQTANGSHLLDPKAVP